MHNALQGAEINLTEDKRATYEEVVFENAVRMHLDHDLVIVHDPQPLPLIRHFRKKAPWIDAVMSTFRVPIRNSGSTSHLSSKVTMPS